MKNRSYVTPDFSLSPPPPPRRNSRQWLVLAGVGLVILLIFGVTGAVFVAFSSLPTPMVTPPTLTPVTLSVIPAVAQTAPPTAEVMPLPAEFTATVTNVINVSTIEVTYEGETYQIYYLGLGTLPMSDCAAQGQAANAALVANRSVRLVRDITEVDEIGRLPRYVFLEDTLVNLELLRQGYARFIAYAPNEQYNDEFAAAVGEAQQGRRGCYAAVPQMTLTTDATVVPDVCGQYFACLEFGTLDNYNQYIAQCSHELPIFDRGGDGIGCNQRSDFGYAERGGS